MAVAKVLNPLERFPLAPIAAVPRILAVSCGDIGSGKTHFACTAPGPIVFHSFDQGTEGVVEDFRAKGKEIRVVEYDWTPANDDDSLQVLAIELRDKFIENLKYSVQHARTVVIDKETAMWSLFRYAEFGSPKADVPKDFDKVNALMRKYIHLPKRYTCNFICIQDVKEEWVSQNKKSGGFKRDGFRETPGIMNVDLWHERKGGKFTVTIGKGRAPGSREAQDQMLEEPFDFASLGRLLYPDSELSDWR